MPFSFRTVNLKTGKQNEPEYIAVNRYGKVPALRHRGLTIVQSNVILDYLARVTGQFEGASEQDRWRAREWLSWEADAIQNIARVRHFSRFRTVDPAVMAHFRPLAEEALAFMDKSLEGRDWLVGEACTIADIGCWGRMVFMAEGGMDIAQWPNVEAWSRRLEGHAGLRAALRSHPQEGPGDAAGLSGKAAVLLAPTTMPECHQCAGRLVISGRLHSPRLGHRESERTCNDKEHDLSLVR